MLSPCLRTLRLSKAAERQLVSLAVAQDEETSGLEQVGSPLVIKEFL